MDRIHGTISTGVTISGTIAAGPTISGGLTIPAAILPQTYEGPYTVTPGEETQTLETNALYMCGDIIVEPIPNNYGLITWDGHTITVS